jgi:hypothetical protein
MAPRPPLATVIAATLATTALVAVTTTAPAAGADEPQYGPWTGTIDITAREGSSTTTASSPCSPPEYSQSTQASPPRVVVERRANCNNIHDIAV